MPPIFVDGVEMTEVWVDGVEQTEVWADGVQVFASGPVTKAFVINEGTEPFPPTLLGWDTGFFDGTAVYGSLVGDPSWGATNLYGIGANVAQFLIQMEGNQADLTTFDHVIATGIGGIPLTPANADFISHASGDNGPITAWQWLVSDGITVDGSWDGAGQQTITLFP